MASDLADLAIVFFDNRFFWWVLLGSALLFFWAATPEVDSVTAGGVSLDLAGPSTKLTLASCVLAVVSARGVVVVAERVTFIESFSSSIGSTQRGVATVGCRPNDSRGRASVLPLHHSNLCFLSLLCDI